MHNRTMFSHHCLYRGSDLLGLLLRTGGYHNIDFVYRNVVVGKVTHRCFSETPWQLWAWEKCEGILAKRRPVPVSTVPVIEVPEALKDPSTPWKERERYSDERFK